MSASLAHVRHIAGDRETLNWSAQFKEPAACSERERQEFARLVRKGFNGSDAGLVDRIERARLLAFQYANDDSFAAIAGLKSPDERSRRDVFDQAAVPVSAERYEVELGWVYVLPSHRGKHIAEGLCRRLLAFVPGIGVFATTNPDNIPMIRILVAVGFEQIGRPCIHRNKELVVFLRP